MRTTIPESLADVTPSWLRQALIDDGRIQDTIAAVTIEPMAHSKGLIGDLALVHIDYTGPARPHSDRPDRLALKLPAANPDSRRIGTMLNAYGREAAFYEHVAGGATASRLARCFCNLGDPALDRWALAIEFIEPDPFDFFAGATDAQAHAAIDALADVHATWWGGATEFEWMPGFDRGGVGGLQPLWINNLPAFVERYRDVLPGPTAEWVQHFAPQLADWSSRASTEPLTLVHADYRIDNMLFHADGVTIIDWQTAMRAPAAMDVSCFIATSLQIDQRRDGEADLIDRYVGAVEARGVVVDRSWFLRSYDENLLWWMGQFGNNLAHLNPGDDLVQQALTTMVERVYAAGHDHNVGRLLSTRSVAE